MQDNPVSTKVRYAFSLGLAATIAFVGGCKRHSSSLPPAVVTQDIALPISPQSKVEEIRGGIEGSNLSPVDKKSLLDATGDLRLTLEQENADRKELVAPSPPGFVPESAERKIRLTLFIEKAVLHRGGKPRFRLEMTNVGRETMTHYEDGDSFFKSCRLSALRNDLEFDAVLPSGRQTKLLSPSGQGDALILDEIKFPQGWTEDQKANWIRVKGARDRADAALIVHIRPGETLRTRGDAPGDPFCTLRTESDLSATGTYKIRVKFDDSPALLREENIRAMEAKGIPREMQVSEYEKRRSGAIGAVYSNEVSFEAAPR
jgi:hypothetical protein